MARFPRATGTTGGIRGLFLANDAGTNSSADASPEDATAGMVSARQYERLRKKLATLEKLIEDRTRHLYSLTEEMSVVNAYLTKIIDEIADVLLVVGAAGDIQLANSAACKLLRSSEQELLAANVSGFLQPEEGLTAVEFLRRNVGRSAEAHMRTPDGRLLDMRCTISLVSGVVKVRTAQEAAARYRSAQAEPAGECFVLLAQDISERKSAMEEIEGLARFTDENPSMVLRISTDMKLLYANPAAAEFIDALDLQVGKEVAGSLAWPARSTLEDGNRTNVEEQVGEKTFDLLFVPFRDKGYVNVYGTDITQRVEAETQLIRNAFYDTLTGLPNRALLKDHILHAIRIQQRNPEKRFALLAINLDRFKYVNETYGHAVGDQLLHRCGEILSQCFRAKDTISRFSADGFCVLQSEVEDTGSLLVTARRVLEAFEKVIFVDEHEIHLTVSIGIAYSGESGEDYEDPDAVIRDADTALYRAKSVGRGKYEVFDHSMHQRMSRTLQLEARLRSALENNGFQMFYQPKVSTDDATLCGFEALIRWTDPEEGFISPAEFIPVAEDTGLIIPLSDWILRDVCRQVAEWHAQTDKMVPVAVNCSGKQFAQRDFVPQFQAVLDEFGVPPELVQAELTESSLVDDVETVVEKLQALADIGVKTSIDDFGTGYSSLAYLKLFPVHTLKVDRSFIKDMHVSTDDHEITAAIIAMAHKLGMEVVAEGVENEKQLVMLLQLGCELIQGYYFSPPVVAASAFRMIRTGVTNIAL